MDRCVAINAKGQVIKTAIAVVTLVLSGCGAAVPEASPPRTTTARPTEAGSSPQVERNLPDILDELAEGRRTGAIALVRTPEQVWRGASGLAPGDRPADPGDRFGIASTTKTFVATVVLQLVGEGHLSLDDSVERWLPGRVREGERITIRQLLNHTSGIPMGMGLVSIEDQGELLTEPGASHHYSNTNYSILGLIVEEVTGSPVNAEVRDRIFAPLELQDSSYGSASVGTKADDLPPWLGAEEPVTESVGGAGGIVSTAADLATFYSALLRGEMLDKNRHAELLRTIDTSGDALAGRAAADSGAGLGIFGLRLECGLAWGHGGDMGTYSNQVLASPDGSRIVVVAQNTAGWPATNAKASEMYCLG